MELTVEIDMTQEIKDQASTVARLMLKAGDLGLQLLRTESYPVRRLTGTCPNGFSPDEVAAAFQEIEGVKSATLLESESVEQATLG